MAKSEIPLANKDASIETVTALQYPSAAEISDDVQALSHELHSSKLEYLGVVAGIRSLCKEFGEHQGMEINFKTDAAAPIPSKPA